MEAACEDQASMSEGGQAERDRSGVCWDKHSEVDCMCGGEDKNKADPELYESLGERGEAPIMPSVRPAATRCIGIEFLKDLEDSLGIMGKHW